MSFSSEQKNEIITQQHKNQCCRKALLNGILSAKATVFEGVISLNVNSDETVTFVSKLVLEIYGKKLNVSRAKTGGRAKILSFSSRAAERYLENIKDSGELYADKCAFCRGSYLKGYFLASGRVCDPVKQYLLEFSPVDTCEIFLNFLSKLGIEAKFTERKREKIIYIKKSSVIEDFFALAGMNGTAFHFINTKIENEIRNNVNRVANCETNNIGKAVTASHSQIVVIKKLKTKGLLSSLPEELERTANLRIEHEDLSLSALAKIAVPPISKSGLSHRLNKIMELGKALLKE